MRQQLSFRVDSLMRQYGSYALIVASLVLSYVKYKKKRPEGRLLRLLDVLLNQTSFQPHEIDIGLAIDDLENA